MRAVLLLLLGYLLVSCLLAAASLWRANHHARALVTEHNVGSVSRSADALRRNLFWANVATSGPVWWLGGKLPWVGEDVEAIRVVAHAGSEVTHSAAYGLIDDASMQRRLLPKYGRFDLDAIEDLDKPVQQSRPRLQQAAALVDSIDDDVLTRSMRVRFRHFASVIRSADRAAGGVAKAVRVLPTMLGENGPRTYLLLFGNNAEARATGGQPGAYAVLKTDRGKVELARLGIPADIGQFKSPVAPQSAAEKAIYYDQIASLPQDTSFTPEFPRTADLLRAMWRRSQPEELNGVLSMDAVTLSDLLRGTGPIMTPSGPTLTEQNALSELINGVYFRIPTNEGQNEYFKLVAKAIFNRIVAGDVSPTGLGSALVAGAEEGRVYVHDFDPAVQRAFAGTEVAGDLSEEDSRRPQIGVYFNDATGSHMSYYLRTDVKVSPEGCSGGVQSLAGSARFTYTKDSPPVDQLPIGVTGAGQYGTPKGQQLLLIRVYGPRGGTLTEFKVDGKAVEAPSVIDRGRPVSTIVVLLSRGQTVPVTWRVHSGAGQSHGATVSVTPGIEARPANHVLRSACAGTD